MITEKVGVFKDFSGRIFSGKMQVIHRLTAFRDKVIHNILWSVGKPGTSFPGNLRVFLHFRVKKCGIVHSVFPGKILSGGECTGKRENCGETGHQREARKGSGGPEPAAPSGRNRQAERRKSQGAMPASRLCEFPGLMSLRRGFRGEAPNVSISRSDERKKQSGSEANPDGR